LPTLSFASSASYETNILARLPATSRAVTA
jgi:hypothetical protein